MGAVWQRGFPCVTTMVLVVICATLRGRKQNIPLWQGFPKIDLYYKKRIITLGVGIGFFITAELVLFTSMNAYAGGFSPIKMAAWGVVFQVWNVLFASVLGMGEACIIYLAEEAGKRDRITYIKGFWIYMGLISIWCMLFSLLLLVFPDIPTRIILQSDDVHYAQISTLAQSIFPFMVIGFIMEAYVQIINRSLTAINDTNFMPYAMWLCYGLVGTVVGYIWIFIYGGDLHALMGNRHFIICFNHYTGGVAHILYDPSAQNFLQSQNITKYLVSPIKI